MPTNRPLAETTARLKARLDQHEATDTSVRGLPVLPSVPLSKLAEGIRKNNDARARRMSGQELVNAKDEIALACDMTRDAVRGGTITREQVDLLYAALGEFLLAKETPRKDSLVAMREAIARLNEIQKG